MRTAARCFLVLAWLLAATCTPLLAQAPAPEVSAEEMAAKKAEELPAYFIYWSPITRHRAAEELAGRGEAAVKPAIAAMGSASPEVRRAGCDVIARMCNERFAGRVRGKGKDSQDEARREAAPAVAPLTRLLADADPWVRYGAAEALAAVGPAARPAAAAIFRALADPDEGVVEQAAQALAAAGADDIDKRQLYPALVKLLQHRRARTRTAAVQMLDKMGDDGRQAAPALLTSVRERCPDSMFGDGPRIEAAKLLAKWQAPEAVDACIVLLDEKRWGAQHRIEQALRIVAGIGPAAKAAIPAIERAAAAKSEPPIPALAEKALAAIKGTSK
jgi:hypothetical protein